MASRTAASTSASLMPRFLGPKATSSRTVSAKSWYSGYWATKPTSLRTSRRCFRSEVERPSMVTVPEEGTLVALQCSARVDLPEPVWPMKATNSPSRTVSDTSLRAGPRISVS